LLANSVLADSDELVRLRQTSKAFSQVAKKAIPAVVFIKVEKTIDSGSMMTPGVPFEFNDPFHFFGDEFFDRFFRDRLPRQPRKFRQEGQGSGFIISKDGYILTNNHVVGDADLITVKIHDGREYKAKVVGSDEKSDVALIKIEGEDLPVLPLGDSDDIEIGEWVVAIGNPFGLTETLTFGVVSAKGRSEVRIADYEDFIQTDAAINPGNSGGPLISLEGKAIGINTAIFSRSGGYMGIGFAIPINMAKYIKEQLIKSGKVTRGQLGVILQDVDQSLADSFGLDVSKGSLVAEVLDDSAADKAGLKSGDIILKFNDKDVEGPGQLKNLVGMTTPGEKVELVVFREGTEKRITVKVGELTDTVAQADVSDIAEKLGLMVQDISEDTGRFFGGHSREGVIISRVEAGSPADRVGVRPGDIVISVNQRDVDSVKEFNKALKESAKSKKVLMLIKGKSYTRFVVIPLD
jgi:serine protease Do